MYLCANIKVNIYASFDPIFGINYILFCQISYLNFYSMSLKIVLHENFLSQVLNGSHNNTVT